MSDYTDLQIEPDYHAPPFYSALYKDVFRFGSFVHVARPGQDRGTTTVARLIKWVLGGVQVQLFYPLFPKPEECLRCHPTIPKHNNLALSKWKTTELYESNEFIEFSETNHSTGAPVQIKDIFYPAFVFSLTDMESSANQWANGTKNVYVVRFRQHSDRGLIAISEDRLRFLVSYDTTLTHHICPPRSVHLNIWTGLHILRKGIAKILNRRSGSSEERGVYSLSLGYVPTETFDYLNLMIGSQISKHCLHKPHPASETYLDMDQKFTRRKIKMTFQTATFRFASVQELDVLRSLLGFSATYGSTEIRPTLYHGSKGLSLKRGHTLSLVCGRPNDQAPPPFKKRCLDQRIDITFSQYACRITVSYQRYHYDKLRSGSLKVPPPTEHLRLALSGGRLAGPNPNLLATSTSVPEETTANQPRVSESSRSSDDDAVRRISDSSSLKDELPTPAAASENRVESDNEDSTDISLEAGEMFHKDGTIWEVIDIFKPEPRALAVILEIETGSLYTTDTPEPPEGYPLEDDAAKLIGTIPANAGIYVACRVSAGDRFNRHLPDEQQSVELLRLTDDIQEAIRNYR